jgi:hypothetical protein
METRKFTPKPKVDFPINTPVVITLDVTPSAQRKTEKPDMEPFWTMFTADGRVFWARQALYDKLETFQKGDTVEVTMTGKNAWDVQTAVVPSSSGTVTLEKVMAVLLDVQQTLREMRDGKEEKGTNDEPEKVQPQAESPF